MKLILLLLLFMSTVFCISVVGKDKRCYLQMDPGICPESVLDDDDDDDDPIPRWFYEEETDSCEKMLYFGCGGNGNRFRTKSDCIDMCVEDDDK
ncbi:kunitz-type serine protease inhibitor-like [Gigantopelta aegis]|uniref:kunitz-type serine protease inhibitor-like n=1 Tax=Gigantopelta aegis TaxID=1735272 RepID=UPI001B8881B7|nr:kunitz-type serine protease inhibitor-like [Gigantopelta aegis]XP_041353072.1 kunitz-type serine protease inhibitor-like [Gigantopelta aegis]